MKFIPRKYLQKYLYSNPEDISNQGNCWALALFSLTGWQEWNIRLCFNVSEILNLSLFISIHRTQHEAFKMKGIKWAQESHQKWVILLFPVEAYAVSWNGSSTSSCVKTQHGSAKEMLQKSSRCPYDSTMPASFCDDCPHDRTSLRRSMSDYAWLCSADMFKMCFSYACRWCINFFFLIEKETRSKQKFQQRVFWDCDFLLLLRILKCY